MSLTSGFASHADLQKRSAEDELPAADASVAGQVFHAADNRPSSELAELEAQLNGHKVIRRTGQIVNFDSTKIRDALKKAFIEVANRDDLDLSPDGVRRIDILVGDIVAQVIRALLRNADTTVSFAIEDIQDQVELALLRSGNHTVGAAYKTYRDKHAEQRRRTVEKLIPDVIAIRAADGSLRKLDPVAIHERIEAASHFLSKQVDCELIMTRVYSSLHDQMTEAEFERVLVLETSTLIEEHPDYSYVAASLLLDNVIVEVMGASVTRADLARKYATHLPRMLDRGIKAGRINPQLGTKFDLRRLGAALQPDRDRQLGFLGLQTLYDRYLLQVDGKRIELPQSLWMRVAMGLALEEDDPTTRAIEFYELLSSFRFMSSTPTLFNSGTSFSQLSSCYLSTVGDDLSQIYGAITDNAMLAKFAGGLGNDWTPVRAKSAMIRSTGGKSQGVVPFLRVVNDTALAVNQGGKRNGAVCCYLETWHSDIREFLELRKNTGDERRRTHDMNTANWIPDLFMKRVSNKGKWTLLSPSDAPDLHDLYGRPFEKRYMEYEKLVEEGRVAGEQVDAFSLWQSMIRMLYETGHPWFTFKDPCNVRSPQQHAGVVHSSNLCTEITLNTSATEIAVCNLGSVNLVRHLDHDNQLDKEQLRQTVGTAMRMLDNVIDINYYAVGKARDSNLRHRPVGLGQAGYQDCLYKMGIDFESAAAVEFADHSTELIAYYAYGASADLASERGSYESYDGSQWSKGILPLDTLQMLAKERGGKTLQDGDWLRGDFLEVHTGSTLDWETLRAKILKQGMRNSNCLAIAPTATISNIMGVSPCIEPTYQNIFVKTNLSGNFKIINRHLVDDLHAAGLWDAEMISEIKSCDGEIADIERIPASLRARYKTAFGIEPRWLIEAASRRQKWIDQSQSLNLFVAKPSGRRISDMYMHAWRRGLKTTYYCRSLQASSTEKYTTAKTGQLNNVAVKAPPPALAPAACAIDDPECEACQ